ncbi:MAG: hypothetical protein A3F67_10785 [Verrucomicrobia bacterium RIFCSPHIGHO2_12_FULL_41_10]|nr:MAG: hypothetical protein A3F67_10785 [Verrucomicrobia bacterium RIFCSPHIGHO2_12_FULL_41_10]HLB34081.1 transposase [Chthoniobacterales bacterium]
MNRRDRGELIFLDDRDRESFLKTLGEVCVNADWQIHAYYLMSNHFHLVLETPKSTLVDGMKWLLGIYTQRFNARHQKLPRMDLIKIEIAQLIRSQTTLSLKWIAWELKAGVVGTLALSLRKNKKEKTS